MRRATSRGGLALALVAMALGLLQVDLDEAAGKKKKQRPWWGTFARSGPIFEPRPGYTWDVNYTLQVSKKKRTWSVTNAVGRFNCWDGSVEDATVTPTSDYFEVAIPPISGGGLIVQKKPLYVRKDAPADPIGNAIVDVSGQTPTGRGFRAKIAMGRMAYPVFKNRWLVAWRIQYQCDGGPGVGTRDNRNIPSYASRQVG
jgi:hypothetical protein